MLFLTFIAIALLVYVWAVLLTNIFVQNSKLVARGIAFLIRGKAVLLTDHRGKDYISIARTSNTDNLVAPVYWWMSPVKSIGQAILLENGRVSENSESIYIHYWKEL